MERGEEKAQISYEELAKEAPEALGIRADEESHEQALLAMLDEERLSYVGSMVLGVFFLFMETHAGIADDAFRLATLALGMVLLAPRLLGVDVLDAAIMGAVVGAVSPAVIVPRMLRLMEEGYGADKGIPQMILAGASVDDVFVIVLFTSFTGMAQGGSFSLAALAGVPVSIVLGGAAGLGLGYVLAKCFTRFHLRD